MSVISITSESDLIIERQIAGSTCRPGPLCGPLSGATVERIDQQVTSFERLALRLYEQQPGELSRVSNFGGICRAQELPRTMGNPKGF